MTQKKGIGRLFEIAGERKGLLLLSGILSAVSAAFMLVPYAAVYFILAELLRHAADVSLADGELMVHWGVVALVGLLIGMAFLYASIMASHVAAFRILYGLRVRLTQHIGTLHLGFLTHASTGAVKKILDQNVERIEKFVAHQIPDMVNLLATVLIMFCIMLFLNGWMGLACLAAFLIGLGVHLSALSSNDAKNRLGLYHDALERISASAVQYVRGMPAVKLFGQNVRFFCSFQEDMIRYRDIVIEWTDSFQNRFLVFKTILGSFLAFVLPVGVLLLSREPDNMALALTILFFIIMTPGTAAPLYKLLFMVSMVKDISEGVSRIDAIFSETGVVEPEHPELPESYNVEFADVSFSYAAAESSTRTQALSHVSFLAAQGTLTALVGPSGSGKSTVANLIPRFWDAGEGVIRIGGVDIRKMRTTDLMNTVSFVFQDTFLFYDSLYENIRVGKPGASKEEVEAAARAAQCHEFIERLPQGYDTKIGEGGVFLSGGEEQRVSIARAILKDAPILVLDEATAFADPENEYKIYLALRELMKDKTVIAIAHRLATIRKANNIIVLDQGRIAEHGKHEQLLAAGGLYKQMWETYSNVQVWGFRQEEVA